ncbi:exodeoxyribonuclease VII large subunit, partial [Rhizobium hidalgonense]
ELAATLSQVNVPIWVGIGHERDRTILDEIAHRSFDTPSKVIAGIKSHIVSVTSQAQQYFEQIYSTAHYEFNAIQADIEAYLADIKSTSKFQLAQLDYQIDQLIHEQKHLSQRQVDHVQQQAEQLMREILLQSPKQTLDRGYAIVRLNGKVVT